MTARMPQASKGARRARRRGSAYVMMLACAVIVTAITLGGIALNKAQRDVYQAQDEIRRARQAAASGLEASTQILMPTVDARRSFDDPEGLPKQIDNVDLAYDIIDASDGDLTDDITQAIDVTVEARVGSARQMITGRMTPRLTPIGMAKYGLAATAAVKLTSTKVDVAAGVYSGTGVTALSANIWAPVFSPENMTGSTYMDTTTRVSVASAVDTSDPTELCTEATRISYNAIPGGRIDKAVLSPTINPFGAATNPRGIYLIDCGGQRLRIRDSRIVGTLIVLNAKADSDWEGGVSLSSYDPRLPAMVWLGDLTVATDGADFTETAAVVSFNPTGAPYLGQSDTDKTDQYPSLVTGTMVVIGDLTIDGSLSVDGRVMVVGNVVASNATIRVREDPDGIVPDCLHEADGFELVTGHVRREVDVP